MRMTHYLTAGYFGLAAILTLGCHDSTAPIALPPTGTIKISVSTVAGEVDAPLPTGYALVLQDGSSLSIGINDTRTIDGIRVGRFRVSLGRVPRGCTFPGTNARYVDVTSDNVPALVSYSVTCVPMPDGGDDSGEGWWDY